MIGKKRSTLKGELPGARELDNAKGLKEAKERIDLRLVAGDFADERVGGEINDLGAKHIRDLQQLSAGARVSVNLNKDELTGDGLALAEVGDFDDVDQFAKLLCAQVEGGLVALKHNRDTRERSIVRRRDVEGIDVETAAGNHAGHAG